uniref:Uncharacterized protein n=8 Tax=unclassified Caudoviricetes TaxID=2788787 RepID=A0AB39U1N5_9CAUD
MAMTKTKRRKNGSRAEKSTTASISDFLHRRLTKQDPDPRSHAEFLADMRAKQAAGRLANPATAALLDRLERAIR